MHFEFAAKIGGTAKLAAILKLKYVGGTAAKLKVKPVPVNTGGAWVIYSLDHSEATLVNVSAIRVQLRHGGGTGKIRVDDVALQRVGQVLLPRGDVIPLPVPPEGFRGEN